LARTLKSEQRQDTLGTDMDLKKKRKPRPDLAERNRRNAKHNMEGTSTYNIWRKMRERCNNPKRKDYPRYGGRGIKVDENWSDFRNFLSDVGVRPEGMQLDRIDNDGNYEPGNVRWVTPRQNANNKRNNVKIDYRGETKTIAEWARHLGICPKTFRYRLKNNWSLEDIFNVPVNHSNRHRHQGE
jgi:hypothetical protein